jgi:transposase
MAVRGISEEIDLQIDRFFRRHEGGSSGDSGRQGCRWGSAARRPPWTLATRSRRKEKTSFDFCIVFLRYFHFF